MVPPSDGVNMHWRAGSLGDWDLMDSRAVATYPKYTMRITDCSIVGSTLEFPIYGNPHDRRSLDLRDRAARRFGRIHQATGENLYGLRFRDGKEHGKSNEIGTYIRVFMFSQLSKEGRNGKPVLLESVSGPL